MTITNNSLKKNCFTSLKFNSLILKEIKIIDVTTSSNGNMFLFKKTVVDLMENISFINVNCREMFSGENSTITLVNIDYSFCGFDYIFCFSKKRGL